MKKMFLATVKLQTSLPRAPWRLRNCGRVIVKEVQGIGMTYRAWKMALLYYRVRRREMGRGKLHDDRFPFNSP